MSNCHLVAGRSLIDLVASRLALRAPALRAATTLTRPTRSAHWLPCSRRAAPTGKMVGPSHVITYHCVECRYHLAHHGHDCDLWYLACCFETMTEGLKRRIPELGNIAGELFDATARKTLQHRVFQQLGCILRSDLLVTQMAANCDDFAHLLNPWRSPLRHASA